MRLLHFILLFALPVALASGSAAHADEMFRPTAYEAYAYRTPQKYVFVPGAEVAFVDYEALRRDIPALVSKTNHEIDHWIITNFSYVSENQLRLRGIRSDDFKYSDENTRTFMQPFGYNRAAVEKDAEYGVFFDVKGSGHGTAETQKNYKDEYQHRTVEGQVAKSKEIMALEDATEREKALDQLRTQDHSDGLMTLGEAIAETTRQKAIQRAFDHVNAKRGTSFQTVESYFILVLPARILKKGGQSDRAALYGRQAHIGRESGLEVPPQTYRDDFGGRQHTDLDSAIDYGGAVIEEPHLQETFGPPSESINKDGKTDAQLSRAWLYAHETANAFDRNHDRTAVEAHIETMLKPLPPVDHRESREMALMRYCAHRRFVVNASAAGRMRKRLARFLIENKTREPLLRQLIEGHTHLTDIMTIMKGTEAPAADIARLQVMIAKIYLSLGDSERAAVTVSVIPKESHVSFDEVALALARQGRAFNRFEELSGRTQELILEEHIAHSRLEVLQAIGDQLVHARTMYAEVVDVLLRASSGKSARLANMASNLLEKTAVLQGRFIKGDFSTEALKVAQKSNSALVRSFANKEMVVRHRSHGWCRDLFGKGMP